MACKLSIKAGTTLSVCSQVPGRGSNAQFYSAYLLTLVQNMRLDSKLWARKSEVDSRLAQIHPESQNAMLWPLQHSGTEGLKGRSVRRALPCSSSTSTFSSAWQHLFQTEKHLPAVHLRDHLVPRVSDLFLTPCPRWLSWYQPPKRTWFQLHKKERKNKTPHELYGHLPRPGQHFITLR